MEISAFSGVLRNQMALGLWCLQVPRHTFEQEAWKEACVKLLLDERLIAGDSSGCKH